MSGAVPGRDFAPPGAGWGLAAPLPRFAWGSPEAGGQDEGVAAVDPREVLTRPVPPPDAVLRYGPGPEQVADVRFPVAWRSAGAAAGGLAGACAGRPPGPVVLIVLLHGGFDKPGAINAGIYAAEIIATFDEEIAKRLIAYKEELAKSVAEKSARVKQQYAGKAR